MTSLIRLLRVPRTSCVCNCNRLLDCRKRKKKQRKTLFVAVGTRYAETLMRSNIEVFIENPYCVVGRQRENGVWPL